MALYRTMGIRDSQATIANHGETTSRWSTNKKDATQDRRHLKAMGFDAMTKEYECPIGKKALIALLNKVATG